LHFSAPDESTLKLLTYNIYMRPTELFANGQGARAQILPSHLLGHDIIVFNEAFDDGIREDILHALRFEYPHKTRILGNQSFGVEDGGVVILSRSRIMHEDQMIFDTICSGTDCSADKGVLYARICKDHHTYHVLGTHLQAGQDTEHSVIREQQLALIRRFIIDLGIPNNQPVLIKGDLNIRRDKGGPYPNHALHHNARSEEFGQLRTTLRALYPTTVADLAERCTYCYGSNELADDNDEGRVTLDYILESMDHLSSKRSELETLRLRSPWTTHFPPRTFFDLSDHYPVAGRFWFEFPPTDRCGSGQ
jgi:endonuclease/exonuclease/phosphatase family metal-dependent hydrolase